MADDFTIDDSIESAAQDIDDATNSASRFGSTIDSVSGFLSKFTGFVSDGTDKVNNFSSSFLNLQSSAQVMDEITSKFSDLSQKIQNVTDDQKALGISLMLISDKFVDKFPVTGAMESLGQSAKDATANIQTTADSVFNLLGLSAKGEGDKTTYSMLSELAKRSEYAKNLEMDILQGAAASGELDSIVSAVGENFDNMDSKMVQFARTNMLIGNATGKSSEQIYGYAQSLRSITGALDMNIDVAKVTDGVIDPKNIQQMSLLEGAVKVAQGTFRDTKSVIEDMKWQFENFNTTGVDSLSIISKMSSVANQLKMPFEDLHSYTKASAEGFKFLGDNTESTINILGKLAPSLQEAGFGPKVITDIAGSMVSSIQQMSMAQKSYLSSQSQLTGNIGGLQGAAKIDLMLKEGKADDVTKMAMESITKLLGTKDIVSNKQASESEEAAAQWYKQIALLSSGPTKVVGNENQAKALIEAMSKGDMSSAGDIISTDKSLDNALKNSDAIADKQLTVLNTIANDISFMASTQSMSSLTSSRMFFGKNSKLDDTLGLSEQNMEGLADLNAGGGNRLYSKKGEDMQGSADAFVMHGINRVKDSGSALVAHFSDFFGSLGVNAENTKKASETDASPIPTSRSVNPNISQTIGNYNPNQDIHLRANGKLQVEVTPYCASCSTNMPTTSQVIDMIENKQRENDSAGAIGLTTGKN